MAEQASLVLTGDFNWISVDEGGNRLLVTGHGVPRIAAYDTNTWSQPVAVADVETGHAQAFWHDGAVNEVYVYNSQEGVLLVLDGDDLSLKAGLPATDVSPGDPWIVADRRTDTVTIVSEADETTGHPFVVIQRATGQVVKTESFDPGNVLLHPDGGRLYLSYFRRLNGIFQYNLERMEVTRSVRSDDRLDRMAMWMGGSELLVASPSKARILRYAADSLEYRGSYRGTLGVRVLAVDESRGLVLFGSLMTGQVGIIELSTGRRRGTYYLGPWLRTISLDEARGIAFISSNGALYTLNYSESK